jgi:hypothetical protein
MGESSRLKFAIDTAMRKRLEFSSSQEFFTNKWRLHDRAAAF